MASKWPPFAHIDILKKPISHPWTSAFNMQYITTNIISCSQNIFQLQVVTYKILYRMLPKWPPFGHFDIDTCLVSTGSHRWPFLDALHVSTCYCKMVWDHELIFSKTGHFNMVQTVVHAFKTWFTLVDCKCGICCNFPVMNIFSHCMHDQLFA
jgi:hypothetical protein